MCDARARRDAVWPCAGVAAGQRVHARLGVPWELWVALWWAWLVSEAAAAKPPKNQYQCSTVTSQQCNRLFLQVGYCSAINEPAMSTSGLPAALGEGAAR